MALWGRHLPGSTYALTPGGQRMWPPLQACRKGPSPLAWALPGQSWVLHLAGVMLVCAAPALSGAQKERLVPWDCAEQGRNALGSQPGALLGHMALELGQG